MFIVELAPQAALAVTLTAVATDAEGALIAVEIDWGNGQSLELAAPGVYTVMVVALDAGGREGAASASVTAAE